MINCFCVIVCSFVILRVCPDELAVEERKLLAVFAEPRLAAKATEVEGDWGKLGGRK